MVIPEFLKPIIQSPELPQILKDLQAYWEDEQARRQDFYNWVTPDMKVEFIEGGIEIHSPMNSRHNLALKRILRLLDVYVDTHQLGYIGAGKVMCSFPRNDYEPDLCFFEKEVADAFHDEQTIFPVPQLVVEVLSVSTAARDRGVKFQDYQANGVKEYWIVDAQTHIVEQYILENGEYALTKHDPKSEIISPTLNGFTVKTKAFFEQQANMEAMAGISKMG